MKLSVATLLILPAFAVAFAPAHPQAAFATSLSAKAAKSKEEDLEMTRKVIADFVGISSAPAPKKEDKKDKDEEKDE